MFTAIANVMLLTLHTQKLRDAILCDGRISSNSFTQRPTVMRINENINVIVFIKDLSECRHVEEKG